MHPPKPKLIRVYFLTTLKDPSAYVAGLREAVAERAPDRFEIVYPVPADLDRSSVHAVVTADPVPGDLATFPNLRLILNLWAGVDGLLADPLFPKNPATTLLRMVDPSITTTMSLSVVSHVLNIHSGTYTYLAQQRNALWLPFPDGPPRLPKDRTVAVLGCGELGAAAVAALHALGFAVVAWSRSPKPSLESHYLRTSSSSPPAPPLPPRPTRPRHRPLPRRHRRQPPPRDPVPPPASSPPAPSASSAPPPPSSTSAAAKPPSKATSSTPSTAARSPSPSSTSLRSSRCQETRHSGATPGAQCSRTSQPPPGFVRPRTRWWGICGGFLWRKGGAWSASWTSRGGIEEEKTFNLASSSEHLRSSIWHL
ncbi:hypothetical protein DFJ73DRAFT_67605 [Zopfochytrium polystomum]|nr:hypothetical protein DFJ73DRAFT_67605 [Zopfochytrium polystomum]